MNETTGNPSYASYLTKQTAESAAEYPAPVKLTIQWGSGGESRIDEQDRKALEDAVDDVRPGESPRSLFPAHGSFGTLSLAVDNFTLWLYAPGGAFIAGELVDATTARHRSVPASGVVDISKLDPAMQAAITTLLAGSGKKR